MQDLKNSIIDWIKDYFNENADADGAIIGLSGGKDSSVVSKLLVEALGKDKVFGVLMPNGVQKDMDDSLKLVEFLGIDYQIVNIQEAYNGIINAIGEESLSKQGKINISPRLRMTTLYAIASSKNYRVAGTGNKSEGFVGYTTKWGDNAHDFNPIASLNTEEVMSLGDALGLPPELAHKTPSDGISGLSDEDNLGFTYKQINTFMAEGSTGDAELDKKISETNKRNLHKAQPIPFFQK